MELEMGIGMQIVLNAANTTVMRKTAVIVPLSHSAGTHFEAGTLFRRKLNGASI